MKTEQYPTNEHYAAVFAMRYMHLDASDILPLSAFKVTVSEALSALTEAADRLSQISAAKVSQKALAKVARSPVFFNDGGAYEYALVEKLLNLAEEVKRVQVHPD